MAKISTESYDSGSNYSFGDKMQMPHNPRSAFNLGHLVSGTYDNCGQVQVLECFPALAGDDIDISVRGLMRALPSVVPLYSRQRDYVYAFYSSYSSLWNNAQVFMTKGYEGTGLDSSGNLRHIPVLSSDKNFSYSSGAKIKAGSLGDSLGLPIGVACSDLEGKNALPFMMLLRIMRDYFTNRNYHITDRVLLPDDDSRFRLDDDGQLLSAKDLGISFKFTIDGDSFDGYQIDSNTGSRTFTQFCHDYPQDYFTSALPWPQRGVAATLEANSNIPKMPVEQFILNEDGSLGFRTGVNLQNLYRKGSYSDSDGTTSFRSNSLVLTPQNTNDYIGLSPSGDLGYYNSLFVSPVKYSHTDPSSVTVEQSRTTGLGVQGSNIVTSFSVTLNQLRELAVNQTELEKAARTDGSFYEWSISFYGEKPRSAQDFRPIYIGGTYSNIQYTEVLQTSAQYQDNEGTIEPIGSPLGTYGGHGITSNEGYLGHVHCDENGYIMILHCVMPDVYYHQGLDRMWTDINQSDMFLPERAKLGLRPILNKELFFSGNSVQDDNLWAYQNIFDEFRYIPNKIKGKIADPNSENFWPYTQARHFDTLKNYGQEFAEASDVPKRYLQAYNEVAFTYQYALDIRAVRELPYKPIPAQILN